MNPDPDAGLQSGEGKVMNLCCNDFPGRLIA